MIRPNHGTQGSGHKPGLVLINIAKPGLIGLGDTAKSSVAIFLWVEMI